jgi:hypothetical protein
MGWGWPDARMGLHDHDRRWCLRIWLQKLPPFREWIKVAGKTGHAAECDGHALYYTLL